MSTRGRLTLTPLAADKADVGSLVPSVEGIDVKPEVRFSKMGMRGGGGRGGGKRRRGTKRVGMSKKRKTTTEVFLVEKILEKKTSLDGVEMFWIKWRGYPEEANTWEPRENLNGCEGLLQEFHEGHTLGGGQSEKDESGDGGGGGEELNPIPINPSTPPPQPPPLAAIDNGDNPEDEEIEPPGEILFDVMEECPEGQIPKELIAVVEIQGLLTYLVEWEGVEGGKGEAHLILARPFQQMYPLMVIKYYEAHISFIHPTIPPAINHPPTP